MKLSLKKRNISSPMSAIILAMIVSVACLTSMRAQITIPIPNESFETPSLSGPGDYAFLDSTGTYSWIAATSGGTFPSTVVEYAGPSTIMTTAEQGNNFALMDVRNTGNFIYQDTGIGTIDSTKTYTLTVWIGTPIPSFDFASSYSVNILKNGDAAATYSSSVPPGAPDTWTQITVNYTPLAGDNGMALGVSLTATGGTNAYLPVDNFQLQSSAVPEPASVVLLCLGGAALVSGWKMRRK